MTGGFVVILNGVGSVGKSSVAKALQDLLETPVLHVRMDDFMAMMPERLFGAEDGLVFEARECDGHRVVDVRSGPVLGRVLDGMRHAVGAMARAGNCLVVDDVMVSPGEVAAYRVVLAGFPVRFVGLHASLEVLEARERARGDREIGLARGQYGGVHRGIAYDLEIQTDALSPAEVALRIRDAFGLV